MTSHSRSSTTVARKRSKTRSEEAFNPSFADLSLCLVEVIMSLLALKDNIRSSAACKEWRKAAVYVRVLHKHPWLLYFPKRGSSIKLCEPLQWKSYALDLTDGYINCVLLKRRMATYAQIELKRHVLLQPVFSKAHKLASARSVFSKYCILLSSNIG